MTLLSILERECNAVLNENNAVLINLQERIVANQLGRQQNYGLGPIAEEPFDAEPAVQPDACATATVTTSTQQNLSKNAHFKAQQAPLSTNRWSDFDSDDEELPDVSDFLPLWVQPTAVVRIEQSTPILLVEDAPALEEEETEFNCTADLSKQPGEDTPVCHNKEFMAPKIHHNKAGYFSSRLTSISEDEEDLHEAGSDITSDDDTSTSCSAPRTPVDLNEHLVTGPLGDTLPLQDPLSSSRTYNSRSNMLIIGYENETDKRHGKGSKLDIPQDMDRVEHWANCVRVVRVLGILSGTRSLIILRLNLLSPNLYSNRRLPLQPVAPQGETTYTRWPKQEPQGFASSDGKHGLPSRSSVSAPTHQLCTFNVFFIRFPWNSLFVVYGGVYVLWLNKVHTYNL